MSAHEKKKKKRNSLEGTSHPTQTKQGMFGVRLRFRPQLSFEPLNMALINSGGHDRVHDL